MALTPAERSREARELRLIMQRVSVELDDAAVRLAKLEIETPYDGDPNYPHSNFQPKSPWTHKTSRSLKASISKATYNMTGLRRRLRDTEQQLRHLDNEEPRLPYLKRLTRRNDPANIPPF